VNPNMLESLYHRLGKPAYFWPAVLFTIFVALPCLASVLDGVLQ